MLADMARSLSRHEKSGEYLDFPSSHENLSKNEAYSTPKKGFEETTDRDASRRVRILRHHSKITKVKNTEFRARIGITEAASNDFASPPPQLISSLRKFYATSSADCSLEDTDDADLSSGVLPDLLQHIFGNRVFQKSAGSARCEEIEVATSVDSEEDTAQPTTSPISNIETIIGNAFAMEEDSDGFLVGLLSAALCVLTTSVNTSANYESAKDSSESLNLRNGQFFRGLQVSGPLSLIINKIKGNKTLSTGGGDCYLPEEELMDYFGDSADIYEKRIEIQKARIIAEARQSDAIAQCHPLDAGSVSFSDDSVPPVLLHRDDDDSSNEFHSSSDDSDSKESDENPLSDSDQDSSSDSSNDEVIDEEEENRSNNGSDVDREDDDTEDEAHLLEEALALSLAELNTAIAVVANESCTQSDEVCSDNGDEGEEEKESSIPHKTSRIAYDEDNRPCDLPSIPNRPNEKWLRSTWDRAGLNVGSSAATSMNCCDPAALATFGKLPSSNIFIMILSLIVEVSEKKSRMRMQTSETPKNTLENISTSKHSKTYELEAILRELSFGEKIENPVRNKDDLSSLSHTLHLTVAMLDLLATARIELFDALCDELLVANEIDPCSDKDEVQDNYNTDDPATVAVGTGAQDVSNCLEEKGMVRKAAAAAHIAAIRKQRAEKKIDELVELIKLMSLGSFLTLRHLRLIFGELSTRCPLETQHSTFSCEARLRLPTSLLTFTSTHIVAKFHERVQKMHTTSNFRETLFNAMSFKLLLIEASTLWGESVLCIMPNRILLEQSLIRVLDIASSSGAMNLALFGQCHTEVENTEFAWSEKDEHILKLNAACRRMTYTDALDFLVPRPIVQNVSHEDDIFHVPSAFISALGEAVFTGARLTKSVMESVEECYKCICHRIHTNCFHWGGDIGKSEDVFAQPEPKRESLGFTKLLTTRDPDLVFASTKCADSIAIEAPINTDSRSSSVNQRANKVWGTVLSSKCIQPKSGVHRWAVKMEKCERGHIFIGVGTSRASTKTYVGGDKYGWGMIGTQALWHDRKKIRNDYGKTFRTGDTIVVTLDTDAGTLGFSLWTEGKEKENLPSSSDLDFDMFNEEGESKRGKLEDWGFAFEGLPLDTRLFPAVGMYQRDDNAILLGLQGTEADSESRGVDLGCSFYPLASTKTANIQKWNEGICNEGIIHATNIFMKAIDILSDDVTKNRDIMFRDILPSLTTRISALPALIPRLSGKIAYNLLPIVMNCLAVVDQNIEDKYKCLPPIGLAKSGKWNINLKYLSRTMAGGKSGMIPPEERYSVDLEISPGSNDASHEINGSGSNAKNATIHGTIRGNLIHFIEERPTDTKSTNRLVEARLSPCGTKFQGTFDNTKYDSSGIITAEYDNCGSEACDKCTQEYLVRCSYTLSVVVGRLSYILSEGATIHDMQTSNEINMSKKMNFDLMNLIISSPILAHGLNDDGDVSLSSFRYLQELYQISDERFTTATFGTDASWYEEVKSLFMMSKDEIEAILTPRSIANLEFERIDTIMTQRSGGVGSLSSLDSSYNDARKSVVKVLLHHTGCIENSATLGDANDKALVLIWRTALNIVESGVRLAIMKPGLELGRGTACKKHCEHLQCLSLFLVRFEPSGSQAQVDACIEEVKVLYLSISAGEGLSNLRRFMAFTSKKAFLKCIGLVVVQQNLNRKDWTAAGAETMLTSFYSLVNNGCSHANTKSKFPYPGASAIVQSFLSSIQTKAYSAVAALTKNSILSEAFESSVSPAAQSLLLATLACFIQSVHGFIHILREDAVWDFFAYVISHCVVDLKAGDWTTTDESNCPLTSVSAKFLNKSSKITNFDILQATVRILHTILFQLQQLGHESLLARPFRILKSEILHIVQFVVEQSRSRADVENMNIVKRDVDRWNVTKSTTTIPELETISEHNEKRQTKLLEFPLKRQTCIATVEDYMGQLFTCFFTIIRTSTLTEQRHDIQFFKRLLRLFVHSEFEIMAGSHRHRVRYLRLLRMVLPGCVADDEILSSLFSHLGNVLSDSIQEDIGFIEARETISLIRYLYSLPDWRQNITEFSTILLKDNDKMQNSVFSVFGGVPGRIVPGSFVLITSSGSNSLYSESPGKVVSGQGESLPAGGIDGIVAGLSRKISKAGVISSVDDFTSTCEVVLLDRIDYLRDSNRSGTNSIFSVRVERVPASDITSVDEHGLLLDKTFSLETHRSFPMKGALSSAILKLKEECTDDSHSLGNGTKVKYADLVLLLRSNIPFLSTPDLLHKIISGGESMEFMTHLLEFAALSSVRGKYVAANSACGQNLKCLSDFEARFWHLKVLLSSVKRKQNAIKEKLNKVAASLDEKYTEIVSQEIQDFEYKDQASHHPGEAIGSGDNTRNSSGCTSEELVSGHTEGEAVSNNSGSDEGNGSEDDQEEDSSIENVQRSSGGNDELAHLREVAVVQMLELGLPRSWSEFALGRVGGTNIEAAVHFCLERGADMERLIAEENVQERSASSRNRRRNSPGVGASQLLQQLVEMGFPSHWCAEALAATGQNVDEALTWILTNGERLSALDTNGIDDSDSNSEEEDVGDDGDINMDMDVHKTSEIDEEKEGQKSLWPEYIKCPVRPISGRANINGRTLEVGGLPSGGFSSVGTKGVLLKAGKWYYECVLVTAGCIQLGWADSSFAGQADKGDGCGDGPSSWAYDGWRRYRWHNNATEWGCRWQAGDVVGCLVDMDCKEIRFTLNGKGEEVGMGLAFSGDGFKPCAGVYACVSFNRKEKVRLLLGGTGGDEFNYPPPAGYKPVGEAIISSMKELDYLLEKECIISDKEEASTKSYLCDFSNSDHGHEIFAWQHRYYGSDASVHLGLSRRQHFIASPRGEKSLIHQKRGDVDSTIDLMLNDIWEEKQIRVHEDIPLRHRLDLVLNEIQKSYADAFDDLYEEYQDVCLALCILYARKSIVHLVSSMSSKFDFRWFGSKDDDDDEALLARNFLSVVELCCALHYEGWVGEAGTMSLASEALGLAISSNERPLRGTTSLSSVLAGGKHSGSESKGVKCYHSCGYVQMLNSVISWNDSKCAKYDFIDPSNSLAACAEISFSGKGIGAATFLKEGLLSVVMSNESVVNVMIASIRCSVRVLAGVQVYDDDKISSDTTETPVSSIY